MLLRCGTNGGAADEEEELAPSWLRAGALESLAELNELSLALLTHQAAAGGAQPPGLLREVSALWPALDAPGRRRAAACPYLLLDGGFAERERWRQPAPQVGDSSRPARAGFFTVPGTVEVARLLFTYAWHLARVQGAAARLLLGMPPDCAALIGACTLRHMHTLAERHPEWLRPRWPAHPEVWRELLTAAASGETRSLELARLHGLTMLAAEARLATVAATAAGTALARASAPRVSAPAGKASTVPSPRSPARP